MAVGSTAVVPLAFGGIQHAVAQDLDGGATPVSPRVNRPKFLLESAIEIARSEQFGAAEKLDGGQTRLTREVCLAELVQGAFDLRHLETRGLAFSPHCLAEARELYCQKVAEAVKGELLSLPPSETETAQNGGMRDITSECSETDDGRGMDEDDVLPDVEMELAVPGRATIAFLILAHDRLQQLRRLLLRLHDPHHTVILVHVDAKVGGSLWEIRNWLRRSFPGDPSVRAFSEFDVHRGGRSMLEVQLRAFELLLGWSLWGGGGDGAQHEDPPPPRERENTWKLDLPQNRADLLRRGFWWDHFINLSDTHYPAIALADVGEYLWFNRGTSYARITSTKTYDPTLQYGKDATYSGPRRDDLFVACDRSLAFECNGTLASLTPGVKYPVLLPKVRAASGPEWVILSRAFVEHVYLGVRRGGRTRTPTPEARPLRRDQERYALERTESRDRQALVWAIYQDLRALSIPEETFFQTLLLNTQFCKRLIRRDFLYLSLVDARWRRSPKSDFPFQTPWTLNHSHAFEIMKDKPWFVRKIDRDVFASADLADSLDDMARRKRRRSWGRWLEVAIPTALKRALEVIWGELFRTSDAVVSRLERRVDSGLQDGTPNPQVATPYQLRVNLHIAKLWTPATFRFPVKGMALRRSMGERKLFSQMTSVHGKVFLRERMAVPLSPDPVVAPVTALRVGCDWDNERYEFTGEVSVVPMPSRPRGRLRQNVCALSLVGHLTDTGYAGKINILWTWEGAPGTPMRISGGDIPKGYGMFVDLYKGETAPGWWRIQVRTPERRSLAERRFFAYDETEVVEGKTNGPFRDLAKAYAEMFDISGEPHEDGDLMAFRGL